MSRPGVDEPPKLSDEEIVAALRTVAGYFTRPGDVLYDADQLSAHEVKHVWSEGTKVRVASDIGSYTFNVGLDSLANLIGKMISNAHVIGVLMSLARAADDREELSPVELADMLQKLSWRAGHMPSGELASSQEVAA